MYSCVFFKQKTAYEMRISDWSSDVCSSDLDLRDRLYSHLVGLDQAFFERSRSGELVSRLTADTELLRSVVGSTISVALRSVVMVIGSLAMLVATSPRLAAYTLVGIPLCVLPLVIGGRSEEHTSELQSLMRTSYAVFFLDKNNTKKTTQ